MRRVGFLASSALVVSLSPRWRRRLRSFVSSWRCALLLTVMSPIVKCPLPTVGLWSHWWRALWRILNPSPRSCTQEERKPPKERKEYGRMQLGPKAQQRQRKKAAAKKEAAAKELAEQVAHKTKKKPRGKSGSRRGSKGKRKKPKVAPKKQRRSASNKTRKKGASQSAAAEHGVKKVRKKAKVAPAAAAASAAPRGRSRSRSRKGDGPSAPGRGSSQAATSRTRSSNRSRNRTRSTRGRSGAPRQKSPNDAREEEQEEEEQVPLLLLHLALGDWCGRQPRGYRRNNSFPRRKLERILCRLLTCYARGGRYEKSGVVIVPTRVSEYRTTKGCGQPTHLILGERANRRPATKKDSEDLTRSRCHDVLHCTHCGAFHARDRTSATGIAIRSHWARDLAAQGPRDNEVPPLPATYRAE